MIFAKRQRAEQETQKTEQNDAKTVEIKKGDLHDITAKLMEEDESTAELIKKGPLIMFLAFMIFTDKMERRLFGEEK